KFESPADAGLSNRSIGAEAPAAAFGKIAFANFASARYSFERSADADRSNCSTVLRTGCHIRQNRIREFCLSEV
ncbi:MAG: hypothetical protein SOU32_05795, partial [Lachnospiraceae bacterium]|nr:hypothetical protein [Lachnospiraceae bacterium]